MTGAVPASPFDLTGHVALVTGGNSGIGLGMAHGLAAAGSDVCVWGTDAARNEAAAAGLAAHGTRVRALRCDVGDEAAVEEAAAATLAHFGRIDSCFANAGVGTGGVPFLQTSLSEFRRVTRVNIEGAFLTLRAAAAHMVERGGGGVLVGTASLAAIEGMPRGQAYAASKGALISMIRACAVELARYGITAHAVLPGWIDTPMAGPLLHDEGFERAVLRRVPARRWGRPDDFSALAVFLAAGAGGYRTGDTVVVDGGYSIF
ncbi:MAG TPA: SDR family oxidoreductase [Pseudonocardia sp.]|nr:SDR family oxidoreductase [Pseudonocardia sp.]